jgi:formylglycine-generating enzyme required for sulfatase activity
LKVKFSSQIKEEDFPEPYEDERKNKFGMTFKFIESGTFMMGSTEDEPGRNDDNEKLHMVTLDNGFYMQEAEVTKEQWKAIMGFGDKLSHPSRCLKGKDQPMEHVGWDDTQRFINKLNGMGKEKYRLPTEAEWEYACRAGTTTPFAFGKNLTRNANFDDDSPDSIHSTTPVKSYDPNHWGLYDMHGNVSEWCNDYYDEYTDGHIENPTGPSLSKSMEKVIRGGDYRDHANNCRSAFRRGAMTGYRAGTLGFRLVMIP